MNLQRKLKTLGIVFGVFFIAFMVQLYRGEPVEPTMGWGTIPQEKSSYLIEAAFDNTEMSITARQEVTVGKGPLLEQEHLYFHIYPNSFKSEKTAPFEGDQLGVVYPHGFNPGWIEILGVYQNKKPVPYQVMGTMDTILRVTPLKGSGKIQLTFDFKVKLPNVVARMGYGDATVNVVNWYPILAVFERGEWQLDPYYAIGDPFYSEVGDYGVKFSVPASYQLASSGEVVKSQKKKGTTTYFLQGTDMRSFAIILSEKFVHRQDKLGKIQINSYTLSTDKANKALEYGVDSVAIFQKRFGPYPYPQLSVVASDFHMGGMEYPGLVMISKDLYTIKEDFPLEYVIAHEIAHQWWYGVVGNNEVKEPWLDEALTEYSTIMYFEEKYGQYMKEQILTHLIEPQYQNYVAGAKGEIRGILRSLDEFEDSQEYSRVVYSGGALFVDALRKEMGDHHFFRALTEYYQKFQLKNATTKDFFEIFQKNTDKELTSLFETWLGAKFE